jgi:hypothetical protein
MLLTLLQPHFIFESAGDQAGGALKRLNSFYRLAQFTWKGTPKLDGVP